MTHFIVTTLVCAALAAAHTSLPNFTGTWVLDLQKSRLQSPKPDSGTFVITHDGDRFALQRTFVIEGKTDSLKLEFVIGGPAITETAKGMQTTNRMYWEGESLVLDGIWKLEGKEATNVVHYTLSDGGRVLTAHEVLKAPKHAHENFWVFTRQ